MRRLPGRLELPLGEAAPARDQRLAVRARHAGLEDENGPRPLAPPAHGRDGDGALGLLVGDREEEEIRRRLAAGGGEDVEGADEHREAALHVESAGGEKRVVLDLRLAGRKHRVQMTHEEQVAAGRRRTAREKHRLRLAARVALLGDLDGEAVPFELARQPRGDAPQPGRVAALRGDRAEVHEQSACRDENVP